MKNKNLISNVLLCIMFFIPVLSFGQATQTEKVILDLTESDPPCWCKDVQQNGHSITVYNLDSIAANNDTYQAPDCKPQAGTCPGECQLKNEDGKIIGEGICTDESFGSTGEVPPGPGEQDCDCIYVEKHDDYIRYTNVTDAAVNDPNNYVILPPACDPACETKTCKFAYKVPHVGWEIREGYCSGNWPGGADADQKSSEALEKAIVDSKPVLSFFPNPANDVIIISGPGQTTTRIIDLNGRLLVETNEKSVDLSQYAKGIYVITISNGKETVKGKLMKN